MASDRLVVLIAEDSPADRMLLSTIVAREGHRVLTAANGLEAVALFEQERPQLVLMDALMPVMDGFEAARRIKQMAGEALVPVIFLTSLTESEALVRCLEAGGDDFLAKPYNRVILVAKIKAMERLRRLQATVLEQRDLIARHNEHLLSEQRVAKAVFDKVAHSGCLDAPNIRYLQSPHALFNGDLLLAAYNPSGDMYVLLGDFTGHGLPAAIGAMPLAEVFYGMAAKGHSMPEILREMNAKLKRILPVGVFCCATLASVSFQRRTLKVWNGGLPDGYLLRADGSREPLVSRHLPLGVLALEVALERDGEAVQVLRDPGDGRRAHHLEVVVGLIARVVVGDDVLRGQRAIRGVEADAERIHAGQIVHPVRVPEPQRLPAVLPRPARSGTAVEQHEVVAGVQPEPAEVERHGQTGLSRADDHDGGVGGTVGHAHQATCRVR